MANLNSYDFGRNGSITTVSTRNTVLRNTYWLLSLSMLPTALGAFLGIQFGFTNILPGSPFISAMIFMGIAFAFFWGIERTKESSTGVFLLLGFTFFMGVMLSRLLAFALGMSNGASLIGIAALGTGGIFFGLASYASVTKRDFSNMGKFLMIGAVMLIIASLANIFLQLPALSLTISTIAVGLFSLWLLFDLKRIMDGGETNYISATLQLYLSLYNIFVNLLQLLMAFGGGSSKD